MTAMQMILSKIMKNNIKIVKKIFQFYQEGFQNMRLGKTLWGIIAIKFVFFFVIMKMLFFPNFLEENFSNDQQRAEHVLKNLTLEKGK